MFAERILASRGYSHITPLGQGAFGAVFGCTSASGAELAVKMSFNDHACATAQREAETMREIPAHPNILSVLSFKRTSNYSLTALPLASGGDTLKFMQERSCLPLADPEVRGLFFQLVDGVQHMHSSGFVHRDIKCENVLLTGAQRRNILLADFGFTTRARPGQLLNDFWGSLHYSAPEICARVAYDGTKIDIWSMGVVLFAWATGRLPFGGISEDETSARIMAGLFQIPNTVSPALTDLIRKMLHVDPRQRITIEEIRKHEWMAPASVQHGVTRSASEVVKSTSAAKKMCVEQRRNSSPDVKAPNRLSAAGGLLRALFRQH